MLSTFGLERIENGLHLDRAGAERVVKQLEQIERAARTAREQALPRLVDNFPRRVDTHFSLSADEPGLPTRMRAQARPNPQFHRTQYADRV